MFTRFKNSYTFLFIYAFQLEHTESKACRWLSGLICYWLRGVNVKSLCGDGWQEYQQNWVIHWSMLQVIPSSEKYLSNAVTCLCEAGSAALQTPNSGCHLGMILFIPIHYSLPFLHLEAVARYFHFETADTLIAVENNCLSIFTDHCLSRK